MLAALDPLRGRIVDMLRSRSPWGPAIGLGRTLLAGATLGALLCNEASLLFRPGVGRPEAVQCSGDVPAYGLFCLGAELELTRWLAIAGLALVMSGWRPRVTGVLHWWITASLSLNATVIDGGEQVAASLTLLLLPVTLTDPRRNHWHPAPAYARAPRPYARLVALAGLVLISVQVCFIYAQASIAKFGVEQWSNGTAMYYWLTDGYFSAPGWLRPVIGPLVGNGVTLTLLTWSVLVLEYLLGAAILLSARPRRGLFWTAVVMHLGILFVQGIASFAVVMLGALVLGVWPHRERSPLADLRAAAGSLARLAGAAWTRRPEREPRHEPRHEPRREPAPERSAPRATA